MTASKNSPEESQLCEMLDALSRGDSDALTPVMHRYGEEIRRFIRFRMRDSVLRRLQDSIDIEQSVFRRFFQRASSGDLQLISEDELRGYLFALAKNRVRELKRNQSAAKRKASFVEEDSEFQLAQVSGTEKEPIADVAQNELMDEVRSIVGTDDWQAVVERMEGRKWKEVAVNQGVVADTLRKRLQTAIAQIRNRLLRDSPQ